MPDRRRDSTALLPHRGSPHGLNGHGGARTLTAAAQLLTGGELLQPPIQSDSWQREGWDFYESLGEFNYGVEWFGEAMSRVRLTVAKVSPGGDEPEVVTEGPAAELLERFMGGTAGQAQALRSFGVQLSVPGECYLVGREVTEEEAASGVLMDAQPDEDGRVWTVQPVDTVRRSRRTLRTLLGRQVRGWDIQVHDAAWVSLPAETLVCRVWDRNERLPWRAMSPAKPALPIMREIDMYNRQIIAVLLSRIALNGLLLIPDEISIPTSPEYEDAADPFMAELLDIMRAAIKNPGAPSSAAPLPLRIPAEFIEKIKHLSFATPLDDKIYEYRAQAIRRLATTLNLPAEVVTGMGDVNHWTSWQLTEDAIKTHISPKVEIVTRCLTLGWFNPMMQAAGEKLIDSDGSRLIVWYDTSELTQRPDRSTSAIELRKLRVINDTAVRRETGFDEADAPTTDELEDMILNDVVTNPQLTAPALKELTGLDLSPPPAPASAADSSTQAGGPVGVGEAPPSGGEGGSSEESAAGPPSTRAEAPPTPDDGLTASARRRAAVTRVYGSRRARRQALERVGR